MAIIFNLLFCFKFRNTAKYIYSKNNDCSLYSSCDSSNRSQQSNIDPIIDYYIEERTIRHFSTPWRADHFDIDWLPIDLSIIPY